MNNAGSDEGSNVIRKRVDEDDHDLLTFGEVGERLRIEIASARAAVAEAESGGDAEALQRARTRLAALESAVKRNSASGINDANFEKFFGYPGTAKRNLPG
ncbi:acyl-CoA synthetase [Mycolicibacterium holsaticum]|uniref:acyl-CoA synthetase n=1 Tax=Mycolicibacterium holsaticum TaxID=152142 RepID=UPI001C7DE4CD|nr:acyl-CoA synthetase [Mycolicibacterium holsaticum]MDA4108112.1 acyl-CoA synthetase [Mycolicibacterium holsaticum DSM 44478 = JCM 12374]QZA14474.1 acyl-CoA synthetase [Mycolicibacterium holsaticum DSM 44478 = JCM 12374]UNC08078.1 acyl-CoA synthetase [Mycolicibacterium holsaticum DSM 44478 = JCM 12374]